MNEYYVYEWFDTDTNEVFYVGKGKKDRWKSQKTRNKKFVSYYQSHNCDVRKIKENMSEEDAYKLEKETILKYREIYSILCNIDEGGRRLPILSGELNSMYNVSPKERMDEETYKQWRYKHTLITGDKNPNYGNHKLSIKFKTDKEYCKRIQSRPGARNGRATSVKVYDESHNFIREFSYIGEACQYLKDNKFTFAAINTIRQGIWNANKTKKNYLKHYFKY